MALTKAQKKDILSEIMAQMKDAKATVFADYQGMSVKEVIALRSKLREKNINYQVAKKTLIKLAAKELGFGEIPKAVLEGPVAVIFSMEDEIAAAKIVNEASKKNKNLKLRGALLNNRILSVAETKQLASIPSKEELLAKLVYLLKSPIQGFHGVLYGTLAGFVRVLEAVSKKQQKA